jgi:hypothetical protein
MCFVRAVGAVGLYEPRTQLNCCYRLMQAPSIPMVRRHSRGDGQMHFAPAVQVITGNFVTAKRRGIVNGIDFGFMGQVRFVQTEPIRAQLEAGNIVLLTNIGISASGELLNCNVYDVSALTVVLSLWLCMSWYGSRWTFPPEQEPPTQYLHWCRCQRTQQWS